MNSKKTLYIFVCFFILAMTFWRLRVLFFYNDGNLPFLRALTGLTIHHYHYGILLVLIAGLLLIFYEKNYFSVGLMGFGLGSVFDSFVSGLVRANTTRSAELINYNQNFPLTALIFLIVIALSIVFYLYGKR